MWYELLQKHNKNTNQKQKQRGCCEKIQKFHKKHAQWSFLFSVKLCLPVEFA